METSRGWVLRREDSVPQPGAQALRLQKVRWPSAALAGTRSCCYSQGPFCTINCLPSTRSKNQNQNGRHLAFQDKKAGCPSKEKTCINCSQDITRKFIFPVEDHFPDLPKNYQGLRCHDNNKHVLGEKKKTLHGLFHLLSKICQARSYFEIQTGGGKSSF